MLDQQLSQALDGAHTQNYRVQGRCTLKNAGKPWIRQSFLPMFQKQYVFRQTYLPPKFFTIRCTP